MKLFVCPERQSRVIVHNEDNEEACLRLVTVRPRLASWESGYAAGEGEAGGISPGVAAQSLLHLPWDAHGILDLAGLEGEPSPAHCNLFLRALLRCQGFGLKPC